MKRYVLIATMCFLVATSVQAKQSTAPEDRGKSTRAQDRLAELQSRLHLTSDQTEKLRPILEQEKEELRAVRQKYSSEKSPSATDAMQSEMKGIREKYEDQIAAVLTAEQMGEWNKIKEERKQGRDRLAKLQSRLKLTPEQTEQLRPIVEQETDELKAVKAKYASDTSRSGKKNKAREMKGIQEKYADQIAAILTPEQMAEWKKIKEERKQELKEKRRG